MKTISKIALGLSAVLLIVGCSDNKVSPTTVQKVKPTISEESLGLRTTDLYSEKSDTFGDETKYSTNYAGSGHKISRAFQDAPPMIPHDIDGMLPITINNNQCTGCHMPEVASSMAATPIPNSHFTNFRPKSVAMSGANTSSQTLSNVSIKKGDHLVGARFNCSQCHAPQSDSPAPKNNFEAVFTDPNGASQSAWSGTKLMEGIDTTQ